MVAKGAKARAMAEVDYLLTVEVKVIPVEVKAAATDTLRSLLMMMDLLPHPYAIQFYAGKMIVDEVTTPGGKMIKLLNLPYILAGSLNDYGVWLIQEN
jgi:hypothetical protein